MSRSLKSRLLFGLCGLALLVLAGRMAWTGASLLTEARRLRTELYGSPPMIAGVEPQVQMLAERGWEGRRARRLEAAAERQRTGTVLLAMGIALAAGWSIAAYLMVRPKIPRPPAPEQGGSAITSSRDSGSARTDS